MSHHLQDLGINLRPLPPLPLLRPLPVFSGDMRYSKRAFTPLAYYRRCALIMNDLARPVHPQRHLPRDPGSLLGQRRSCIG